jgi:hypothetical protein
VLDRWSPSTVHLVIFAIGGVLVYLGEEWGVPWGTEIGIGCLGVLLVTAGADIVLKRIALFRVDGWGHVVESYRGVLAVLWGLIFICLGLLLVAVMAMTWLAPERVGSFWGELLLSNTGLGAVMSIAGLMLMLNGLIRALAGSGRVNVKKAGGPAGILDRLAGVVLLGFGAVLAGAGFILLVAPGWLMTSLQRLAGIAP